MSFSKFVQARERRLDLYDLQNVINLLYSLICNFQVTVYEYNLYNNVLLFETRIFIKWETAELIS